MNEMIECPMFRYYEIHNTISESRSTVTGRYATKSAAMEALKNCCDWYRPKGTGKIYEVNCYVDYDHKVTIETKLIFENW